MAAALLALAALCCLLAAGTMAWQSLSQTALNELTGGATYANVELVKLERPAEGASDSASGSPDAAEPAGTPLAGAVFQLFTEDGTQMPGTYVTGSDGRIRANLPAGGYYFEETVPPSGYTYDVRDGAKVTRYPFEVTEDVGEKVTVTAYNVRLEGSLSIQKTVTNADGAALTESQRQQGFEFKVELTKGGAPLEGPFAYSVDGGASESVENGGTITLRHGQTAVFADLPQGALYSVAEVPVDGYAVSSTGHRGNIGETPSVASFANVYSEAAPSADASLRVTKQVRNADGSEPSADQLAQEFEFEVTLKRGSSSSGAFAYTCTIMDSVASEGEDGSETQPESAASENPDAEGAEGGSESGKDASGSASTTSNSTTGFVTSAGETFTIKLKHGQTAVIEGLEPGTEYVVEEVAASLPAGCEPTVTRYEGTAVGGSTALLPFVNVMGAGASDTGSLKVTKTVEDLDAGQAGQAGSFAFRVRFFKDGGMLQGNLDYVVGEEAFTVENGGTIYLSHGQTAVFAGLEHGLEYEVTESVDPQSALEPVFSTAKGAISAGEVVAAFVNVKPVEAQESTVRVTKSMSGECPDTVAGRAFMFTLAYRDASGTEVEERFPLRAGEAREFAVPLGAWYEVSEDDAYGQGFSQSITNGAGHATEALVEVEAVNAYIGEAPAGPDVPVVPPAGPDDPDDPEGPDNPDDPDDPEDPDNPDEPEDPEDPGESTDPETPGGSGGSDSGKVAYVDPPAVSKKVEDKAAGGDGAPDRRFEFRLIARDASAPMPAGSSGGVKSIFIENSGSAGFGSIAYAKPGTYVYDIVEVPVDHDHWRYDNAHYVMTVKVTEAGGKLSASRSVKAIGTLTGAAVVSEAGTALSAGSPAAFVNVYEGVGGMGSGANLEQTGDSAPWAPIVGVLLLSLVMMVVAAVMAFGRRR